MKLLYAQDTGKDGHGAKENNRVTPLLKQTHVFMVKPY